MKKLQKTMILMCGITDILIGIGFGCILSDDGCSVANKIAGIIVYIMLLLLINSILMYSVNELEEDIRMECEKELLDASAKKQEEEQRRMKEWLEQLENYLHENRCKESERYDNIMEKADKFKKELEFREELVSQKIQAVYTHLYIDSKSRIDFCKKQIIEKLNEAAVEEDSPVYLGDTEIDRWIRLSEAEDIVNKIS